MDKRPLFSFEHDPSAADFTVSKASYLAARPGVTFGYIATTILVLDTSTPSNPRILLLQRAASDEDPNRWEPPGGACDDDDESILHAAARELQEEAGLEVTWIGGPVGDPHFFSLDNGGRVCRFTFATPVSADAAGSPPTVTLNPREHQRFVWATEAEVRAKKAGGFDLEFTAEEVERLVIQAFEFFRVTRM